VDLAADQLGPGLAIVNEAIHATASLAIEITVQFNAWRPLLSRLDTLVQVADTVAKAYFILNYLSPATTKEYLQTGSRLNQFSMRSRLRSP